MNTATELLVQAALYTDGVLYDLIHLPAPAITAGAGVLAEIGTPFSALVIDKDEVTLVLPQAAWQDFIYRLPDHQVAASAYRLITFDMPLELDLVGFMALVSDILASASVTILPFAAFARDHILVPEAQFETAWSALNAAKERLARFGK
jgi:hypothetical protein